MSRCSRPFTAVRRFDGSVSPARRQELGALFRGNDPRRQGTFLRLRCGKCVGCRLSLARMWALRCFHESRLHAVSSFATLTYSDEYLDSVHAIRPARPAGAHGSNERRRSLDHRDFQLFAKRVRKVSEFRYFMCGEYGERTLRPHYHALLFGLASKEVLQDAWKAGHVHMDVVTPGSVAYVTGYVNKVSRKPVGAVAPYRKMSRRPGIGADFFSKYRSDFEKGTAIWGGAEVALPRFYRGKLGDDVLERLLVESVERESKIPLDVLLDSRSRARLEASEAVAKAKVDLSRRDVV